ncbi:MAG: hypothetical protein PHH00_03020 [Candidatus Nanoarchaeia archaeon]|nr:hypothetical protein [Candidatus Nanoarchaeia archaeon]
MNVIYDRSQDLTLTLSKEEKRLLVQRKTRDFYDNPLRGICPELEAYVYLAYSFDEGHCLANAEDIEGLGRIHVPHADFPKYPWLVNLSGRGVRFLEQGWNHGVRYNGSNKLFIIVQNLGI